MTDQTEDWVTQCLAPFPREAIGTLPKTAKRPALSYVGHAMVTRRLLQVDPTWTWEPMAIDPDSGEPRISYRQGDPDEPATAVLWARITIGGVSRPCVGTCAGDSAELEKELISDLIRNGAMRAGVALDLWAKEDLDAAVATAPWWEAYGWGSADQHDSRHEAILRRMRALPERHLVEAKRAFVLIDWARPETGEKVPLWVPKNPRQVDGPGTMTKTVPREILEQAAEWLERHAETIEAEAAGEEPFDTEPSPARPTLEQLQVLMVAAGVSQRELAAMIAERWGTEAGPGDPRHWDSWEEWITSPRDHGGQVIAAMEWLAREAAQNDAEGVPA